MNPLYRAFYHFFKFLGNVFFNFKVVHPERIIEEGAAILAMNHQSFLDPPLAGISCQREIYFLARRSLMNWPIMGKIFPKVRVIPVDRGGRGDMAALKAVIRVVSEGHATVIFPEGTRSPDGNLQPAQPGLGMIVAKTLAPVIPMRIFGAHEALPKSGKRFNPCPVTIVVGHPIYFTKEEVEKGGREVYQQISDRVMAAIAAIEYED
jgi:1-acyl-sn-glycerol-3-phosphate acyltransferase